MEMDTDIPSLLSPVKTGDQGVTDTIAGFGKIDLTDYGEIKGDKLEYLAKVINTVLASSSLAKTLIEAGI